MSDPGGERAPGGAAERDRRLLRAARAGDQQAFEELYGLYRSWAFALALRQTGERADADDVVAEAFLYVLRRLDDLELVGRLSTLLYPVIRHAARDARNRRGRYRSEEEALASLADRPGADRPEHARAELLAVLAGLPEGQREVVLLRVVDELSVEEVSRALEIPPGTVKSRLFHALAALREDPRARAWFGEPPPEDSDGNE